MFRRIVCEIRNLLYFLSYHKTEPPCEVEKKICWMECLCYTEPFLFRRILNGDDSKHSRLHKILKIMKMAAVLLLILLSLHVMPCIPKHIHTEPEYVVDKNT